MGERDYTVMDINGNEVSVDAGCRRMYLWDIRDLLGQVSDKDMTVGDLCDKLNKLHVSEGDVIQW